MADFSFLDAICGDDRDVLDEEDVQPNLTSSILNAMQAPYVVLGIPPDRNSPWVARDMLRLNCVRLLARQGVFSRALTNALGKKKPQAHAAVLVAHALLDAKARRQGDELERRLPALVHDGAFDGCPADLLHMLRPLARPRTVPKRACSLLAVRCVGARRALVQAQGLAAGEEPTAVDLKFDFEVRYCGRTSIARGLSGAFLKRALALVLTKELAELLLVDDEAHARLAKLCAVAAPIDRACRARHPKAPAQAGRVLARRLQALHRATAVVLRAYSPILVEEVLQLDPQRVWREEEPRVARLLEAGDARSPTLYLVDERWLGAWRAWAFWSPPALGAGVPEAKGPTLDPELPPAPPGPLANARLCSGASFKLCADYRAVGPSLFAYLALCHGGDNVKLPRARGAAALDAPPAPHAECVAGSMVAAFVSRRARLRRKPAPPPKPPPPREEESESDADETTCLGSRRPRTASIEMGALAPALPTRSPLHGALPRPGGDKCGDAPDAEWP